MVISTSKHPNMALDGDDFLPRSEVWLWYGQCSFKLELKHSNVPLDSFDAFDILLRMSLRKHFHEGAIFDVLVVGKAFLVHTCILFGESRSDGNVFTWQESLDTDSLRSLGRFVCNMHIDAMLGNTVDGSFTHVIFVFSLQ